MKNNESYIILNFLHGNGPYLRTIELALSVNDVLEDKGMPRRGIIVPLVYGDRQKIIMEENFGDIIRKRPYELLFDPKMGELLKPLLYNGAGSYEESLRYFLKNHKKVQDNVRSYLQNGVTVYSFSGVKIDVKKEDIDMEVNRCPQLNMGIEKSYYTGFDYISKVLEHSLKDDGVEIDEELIKKCIPIYRDIEKNQTLHFIAEPSIFSYLGDREKKYETEITTPPNTNQIRYFSYTPIHEDVQEGVYVTVTGIPGLEHLFEDIQKMGLRVYTHRPELVPGSRLAPPDIITHENIKFHFARSGWGSLWLSLMTGTPFVTPPYHKGDDLEIYFNNKCIEHLGFGKVYQNEHTMDDLIKYSDEYQKNIRKIKDGLMKKYNTLNGVRYTAEKIVDHFLQ